MIQKEQVAGLDGLAPLDSPDFIGLPTSTTPQQQEANGARIATVAFVRGAITSAGVGGGGTGAAASLSVIDDNHGNIELLSINTPSTLHVTDDSAGNITLELS